ncbi:MAG: hypothetical protein JNM14_15030 [Ferruginibacter sp.]|nr:hypothetical protein [Ferruginibacter sp.]
MGRGIHLTVDEWFYHWFADEAKIDEVSVLFAKILEVCDKIVMQKGTRLALKLYSLVESSVRYPPIQRERVKILIRLFFQNSDKIHWVEEQDSIPVGLEAELPRKDIYLIEMCLATVNKILITTDNTLYKNLADTQVVLQIQPFMAEDFIKRYPSF